MATWNLESVGTKGYGGGGSYLCARAAKAFVRKKNTDAKEQYDGVGVFKDPLMDSAYGRCTSSTRQRAADVEELLKPTELEQALAQARAACPPPSAHRSGEGEDGQAQNRRNFSVESIAREDVQVVFEAPFTSRGGGRKGNSIPLVCMNNGEHAVYVLRVSYNGRRWSVERRYSEFDEVDRALARSFGKESGVKLPALPSKVWVGSLSKENLERRKVELEAYIQAIVAQTKLVHECPELRAFLEIPPTAPARGGGGGQGDGRSTGSSMGSRRQDRGPRLNGDAPDLDGAKSQGRVQRAVRGSGSNGMGNGMGNGGMGNGGRMGNGGGGFSGTGGAAQRAPVPMPSSNGHRDDDEVSL